MENVIEFSNVTKKFSAFSIAETDLKIKKGYITGFIGTNGSGKSTIIKMMMNLLYPDTGEIKIFDLNYSNNEKDIKKHIGFVSDSNIFYPSLNLKENTRIVAPAYPHWDHKLFKEYLKKFELPFNQPIKKFSKGMQMKAALALTLSHNPELIIMDEPTAGLDPAFRRELLGIFQELMMDENKSIFFSTHTTNDLYYFADYIVFIDQGEILFNQSIDDLKEEYAVIKGSNDLLDRDTEAFLTGIDRTPSGFQALTNQIKKVKEIFGDYVVIENASLEDIMFYTKNSRRTNI